MKNLLVILLMLCSLNMYAKSDIVSETVSKTTALVDNAKSGIVNGVNYADTSSTFKTMYKDFKNGIVAMAETLKVGVEHVYVVLVKQQIVYAIVWIIAFVLFFIMLILMIRFSKWMTKSSDVTEGHYIGCTIGWICTGIFLIVCTCHIDTIVTGFVNPEYGAMQDIVHMADQVKNGKTTCESCSR